MTHTQGGLFSEYFLSDGVTFSGDWEDTAHRLDEVRAQLSSLLEDFAGRHAPGEAETEGDLVEPLLSIVGWSDFLPQIRTSMKGRTDVPDYLLFPSAPAKAAATSVSASERYKHGAAILEVKAWDVPLDRAGSEI